MAIGRTDTDYKPVNAMDSTLGRDELIALSAANPDAQFYTPYGVILGGVVVADKALWHNGEFTFVETDLLLDKSGGGMVVAFPTSSDAAKSEADIVLQSEIDDLPDIRRGANKGTQAMAAIESGNLTARDLVGRAEPTIEEFSFRASAGNKSIKDESAVIRRILGNTLYTNGQYRGMSISAIKTVGFNIINTATAISGVFESSGAIVPNDHYSIATARVLPGEAYYFRRVCNGNYYPTYVVYDANGAVLNVGRLTSSGSNASGYVTMPNNAYSVKIAYNNADVNECCANISHTGIRDGEYEPYEEHTLHIPEIHDYFPEGMWELGTIIDELTHIEAIKRIGHIDLGTLEYTYNEDVQAFEAYISDIASDTYLLRSNVYDYGEVSEDTIGDDNMMACVGHYLLFRDSSFVDDTEGFRGAMSGEMLHYELAKPVITHISTPLQLSYWVEDFGTEEALSEGASAPFKAEIVYQFNAVDRIRDNERNILRLEQLFDSKNNISAQPYIVKSGIAADGGKVSDNAASIKALRGSDTLVWNQELNTAWGVSQGTISSDGEVITLTATGSWPSIYNVAPFIKGHKYLAIVGLRIPNTDTVVIGTPVNGNAQYRQIVEADTDTLINAFLDCIEDYGEFYVYPNWNVAASGGDYYITVPKRIDLTLMFGAGNEPTTVEDYYERKPIVADENAYNEGQLAGFGPTWGVKCQTPDGAKTSTKHFDISGIFPHGLNKVGSVRDEMYYDSARRTWVAVHRLGVVDLGTLEWSTMSSASSGVKIMRSFLDLKAIANNVIGNITSEKYTPSTADDVYMLTSDKTIAAAYHATGNYIAVYDSEYPTAEDVPSFRAAMQGVLLCYELAEPVIEDVPFFDSFYNAYEGGTEEIVADIPTTAMDADIAYQYDEQGRIDYVYSKINNL